MSEIDASFWNGRRVLVTGHTGFKGSWLVAWLERMGAQVAGLALTPEESSLFRSASLERRCESFEGDVRDAERVAAVVRSVAPEVVLHLAGQALVSRAHADPAGTFATNVMGTVNVLEAIRRTPSVRAAVCITSDKCYRNFAGVCQESDRLGGVEAYGASKAAAELAIEAWREAHLPAVRGVGVASARAGNVFGAGDLSANRLLPDLVRALVRGETPRLRSPDAVRPWQHVLDALTGYLLLAQAVWDDPASCSEAWNFGPPAGSEWSVARIAETVGALCGGLGWQPAERLAAHEDEVLRLDSGRARERLGWTPRLPMATALAWTVDGYRRLLLADETAWLDDQIDRFSLPLEPAPLQGEPSQGEPLHGGPHRAEPEAAMELHDVAA